MLKRDLNHSSLVLNFVCEDNRRGIFKKKSYELTILGHDKSFCSHAYELMSAMQAKAKRYLEYMQKNSLKSPSFQKVIRNCAKIHTLDDDSLLEFATTSKSLFVVQSGLLMLLRFVLSIFKMLASFDFEILPLFLLNHFLCHQGWRAMERNHRRRNVW